MINSSLNLFSTAEPILAYSLDPDQPAHEYVYYATTIAIIPLYHVLHLVTWSLYNRKVILRTFNKVI